MPPALRDAILGAKDLPTETVEVPEWGKPAEGDQPAEPLIVYVGTMSGLERDEFERWLSAAEEPGRRMIDILTMVVSLTLQDAEGNRLFPADDRAVLGKKNVLVLTRLYDAAVKLNKIGLTQAEAEAGKSAGVPGTSSSSASASTSAAPGASC